MTIDASILGRVGLTPTLAARAAAACGEFRSPPRLVRVAVLHRETLAVHDGSDERKARVLPRLERELALAGTTLAVGDWVLAEADAHGGLWAVGRVPPETQIVRRDGDGRRHVVVANVDVALVVMGLDDDFNLRRLERYLALVQASGVAPVVVLTKADVVGADATAARLAALDARFASLESGGRSGDVGTPSGDSDAPSSDVGTPSGDGDARSNDGDARPDDGTARSEAGGAPFDGGGVAGDDDRSPPAGARPHSEPRGEAALPLRRFAVDATDAATALALAAIVDVPGRTLVLLGSSGAGKSTLTNTLLGRDVQDTGGTRAHDGRGMHTTTARSLHRLPGGACLIDTPGLRTLRVDVDASRLVASFDDVARLAAHCRFRDCAHEGEPGCAVREGIDGDRLRNFRKMVREVQRDQGASWLERRRMLATWKSRGREGALRARAKRGE